MVWNIRNGGQGWPHWENGCWVKIWRAPGSQRCGCPGRIHPGREQEKGQEDNMPAGLKDSVQASVSREEWLGARAGEQRLCRSPWGLWPLHGKPSKGRRGTQSDSPPKNTLDYVDIEQPKSRGRSSHIWILPQPLLWGVTAVWTWVVAVTVGRISWIPDTFWRYILNSHMLAQ